MDSKIIWQINGQINNEKKKVPIFVNNSSQGNIKISSLCVGPSEGMNHEASSEKNRVNRRIKVENCFGWCCVQTMQHEQIRIIVAFK